MKITLSLLVGLLITSDLRADGIPVNESRSACVAPHLLVQLSEDQKEEVVVCGTLTLTREQWKSIREKSPDTPKRLETILPSTYNDCSCGMEDEHFGIWFPNDTVAVLYYNSGPPFSKWSDDEKKKMNPHLSFRLDERGQFYASRRLIPFSEVKEKVSNTLHLDEKESLSVGVEMPPGLSRSDAALADRLNELEKLAKAANRNFNIFWTR